MALKFNIPVVRPNVARASDVNLRVEKRESIRAPFRSGLDFGGEALQKIGAQIAAQLDEHQDNVDTIETGRLERLAKEARANEARTFDQSRPDEIVSSTAKSGQTITDTFVAEAKKSMSASAVAEFQKIMDEQQSTGNIRALQTAKTAFATEMEAQINVSFSETVKAAERTEPGSQARADAIEPFNILVDGSGRFYGKHEQAAFKRKLNIAIEEQVMQRLVEFDPQRLLNGGSERYAKFSLKFPTFRDQAQKALTEGRGVALAAVKSAAIGTSKLLAAITPENAKGSLEQITRASNRYYAEKALFKRDFRGSFNAKDFAVADAHVIAASRAASFASRAALAETDAQAEEVLRELELTFAAEGGDPLVMQELATMLAPTRRILRERVGKTSAAEVASRKAAADSYAKILPDFNSYFAVISRTDELSSDELLQELDAKKSTLEENMNRWKDENGISDLDPRMLRMRSVLDAHRIAADALAVAKTEGTDVSEATDIIDAAQRTALENNNFVLAGSLAAIKANFEGVASQRKTIEKRRDTALQQADSTAATRLSTQLGETLDDLKVAVRRTADDTSARVDVVTDLSESIEDQLSQIKDLLSHDPGRYEELERRTQELLDTAFTASGVFAEDRPRESLAERISKDPNIGAILTRNYGAAIDAAGKARQDRRVLQAEMNLILDGKSRGGLSDAGQKAFNQWWSAPDPNTNRSNLSTALATFFNSNGTVGAGGEMTIGFLIQTGHVHSGIVDMLNKKGQLTSEGMTDYALGEIARVVHVIRTVDPTAVFDRKLAMAADRVVEGADLGNLGAWMRELNLFGKVKTEETRTAFFDAIDDLDAKVDAFLFEKFKNDVGTLTGFYGQGISPNPDDFANALNGKHKPAIRNIFKSMLFERHLGEGGTRLRPGNSSDLEAAFENTYVSVFSQKYSASRLVNPDQPIIWTQDALDSKPFRAMFGLDSNEGYFKFRKLLSDTLSENGISLTKNDKTFLARGIESGIDQIFGEGSAQTFTSALGLDRPHLLNQNKMLPDHTTLVRGKFKNGLPTAIILYKGQPRFSFEPDASGKIIPKVLSIQPDLVDDSQRALERAKFVRKIFGKPMDLVVDTFGRYFQGALYNKGMMQKKMLGTHLERGEGSTPRIQGFKHLPEERDVQEFQQEAQDYSEPRGLAGSNLQSKRRREENSLFLTEQLQATTPLYQRIWNVFAREIKGDTNTYDEFMTNTRMKNRIDRARQNQEGQGQ